MNRTIREQLAYIQQVQNRRGRKPPRQPAPHQRRHRGRGR